MIGNPAYPTYQAFLALGVAALITAVLMPFWIRLLRVEGIGQQVRADGPKRHLVKQGTPTMGGVIILIAVVITCLLVGRVTTRLVLVLVATVATGALGLIDDLTSVTHGRSLGLTPHAKMIGLTLICVAFTVLAVSLCGVAPFVSFPGGFSIDLGVFTTTFAIGGQTYVFPWLYLLFTWLLIAGLSNAVNLTDGLDGLAAGSCAITSVAYVVIAVALGYTHFAIFGTALTGACLGFLFYNQHPAKMFMGDTGSLALGGALAAMAILTKTELLLILAGGLYVIEALSVIIQVISFKTRGVRVFKMSPIHHHFELSGWSEVKVVTVFWSFSALMAILSIIVVLACK